MATTSSKATCQRNRGSRVIRSCQNHNAQGSVINWVIAAYGRKSHLKEEKKCFFNDIYWLGAQRVRMHTLKTSRQDTKAAFTNLISRKEKNDIFYRDVGTIHPSA